MNIFFSLGATSLILILMAMGILQRMLRNRNNDASTESFILLFGQALQSFNKRIFWIFIQFALVANILMVIFSMLKGGGVPVLNIIAFDFAILIYSGVIYIMLTFVPHAISSIASDHEKGLKPVLNKIILAGAFQSLAFLGVFIFSIFATIIWFGMSQLLVVACGILVVSFYYRAAGGAYKAASQSKIEDGQESLTNPVKVLASAGNIIASIGGYYLDIFSSWAISIAAFFIYVLLTAKGISMADFLNLPEVQWVFQLLLVTSIGIIVSIPYGMIRKKADNLFLEMGYVIIGIMIILMVGVFKALSLGPFLFIGVITMLGIAFFTNYLTSTQHQPVRFVCEQAQFGSSQILIASFFNGLIGNAVFILMLIVTLVIAYKSIELVGLLMMIIFMLSIAVVACTIKVYSVITSQVILIFESKDHPILESHTNKLKSVSYTLVAIGNSFSSAAGILSSLSVIITAILMFMNKSNQVSVEHIFGVGLGVIIMSIFYALAISGTYGTLMQSIKEVFRQFQDIPQLGQEGKAHPDMKGLSNKHSINVLKALTFPGGWIIMGLSLIYMFISLEGMFGALMGLFVTVFVHSFFWSIFGDSVASAYNYIVKGFYGGRQASTFKGVEQAYQYAHYFQWVLAPTGVIIMKFVGIITILLLIK